MIILVQSSAILFFYHFCIRMNEMSFIIRMTGKQTARSFESDFLSTIKRFFVFEYKHHDNIVRF